MSDNPAIELAEQTYHTARKRLDALLASRQREQHVEDTDIWLYAALAAQAADTLSKAWERERERLQGIAIDRLPS